MGATWPEGGTLTECCTRIGPSRKESLHILLLVFAYDTLNFQATQLDSLSFDPLETGMLELEND